MIRVFFYMKNGRMISTSVSENEKDLSDIQKLKSDYEHYKSVKDNGCLDFNGIILDASEVVAIQFGRVTEGEKDK